MKRFLSALILLCVTSALHAQPTPNSPALDGAKKKCADLGFEAGTERFGSCVLQLSRNEERDAQVGIDKRLRQVEVLKITHDELSFTAEPSEKRDFDAAFELLRSSNFAGAVQSYIVFLSRYPNTGYRPSALYWLGNAQYAIRDYKEAMENHGRLIAQFPTHLRASEAALAVANSQFELRDTQGARRTLEQLTKQHPGTAAAAAGAERLLRLR
jgi:tol-pal system protein YbgF